MGVKLYQLRFPTDDCKFHPHHHFTKVLGNIWRCKYCWASKYLPNSYGDALNFTIEIRNKGLSLAYDNLLKDRPNTVAVLETLRGIRLVRENSTEEVAKRLEQELVLTLVKDNREISAIRKEMNFGDSKEDLITMLDKITSWDMSKTGRKVLVMKGRS